MRSDRDSHAPRNPQSLTVFSTIACLLGAAVCGCTGPSDSSAPDDSATRTPPTGDIEAACTDLPATIVVGQGAEAYEPLNDGDSATIVHGPQGGWHILAAARVANTRDVVTFTYTIHLLPDNQPLSWNQYRVQIVPFDTCTGDYFGMYGYLDVAPIVDGDADTPPELLAGKELELTLKAEDQDGRIATDSVTVIGQLDPSDE